MTPLIPGHDHLGGQLGPALAIAHGMGLDAPDRLVVALIGDGECETGAATAAAWLGARAMIAPAPTAACCRSSSPTACARARPRCWPAWTPPISHATSAAWATR
ncbi:hypothetical protein [Nocardia sp. NPDC047038]|uniref:hypothetical protein n=1 Tax=Nocardia sp. NPDC047038 TaxID=3154338 RepID=UPI0033E44872